MKIFILGIPHTIANKRFNACAFTMKVVNLCKMLQPYFDVIHIGNEGADVPCQHHSVMTEAEWKEAGGKELSASTSKPAFLTAKGTAEWYKRSSKFIKDNSTKDDFVLSPWGKGSEKGMVGFKGFVVESGIGYNECFAPHRVYETYSWQHYHYGKDSQTTEGKKRTYEDRSVDAVIPNAYNAEDFEDLGGGEAFGFIGRLNWDKGVKIAMKLCQHSDKSFIFAGQGDPTEFLTYQKSQYLGLLDIEKRKKFLGSLKALFVPTLYVEPFGGTHVEAMLSGTPVITTDWGGFSDTVIHNFTGFRCRTQQQMLWAMNEVQYLDRQKIREYAIERFSTERIGKMYRDYILSISGNPISESWELL